MLKNPFIEKQGLHAQPQAFSYGRERTINNAISEIEIFQGPHSDRRRNAAFHFRGHRRVGSPLKGALMAARTDAQFIIAIPR